MYLFCTNKLFKSNFQHLTFFKTACNNTAKSCFFISLLLFIPFFSLHYVKKKAKIKKNALPTLAIESAHFLINLNTMKLLFILSF